MNRLKQARLDALLSVEALADEVGLSAKTIYNLEDGKGARVETLRKIAKRFPDVPASALLLPANSATPAPEREAA